ncbi:DMT family transporter [Arhodomonas sp. AD133]|uniref:DMT family transporter n=1 Tax=Arhodomonas sp. AD133 TaxID=3415009 RepID=UPI003EBBDDBF
MPTTAHYAMTVIAWGLTWTAIHVQVDSLPLPVSIFYRFALAAGLLLALTAWNGSLTRVRPGVHGWLVLQGVCLYSVNFLFLYQATALIPSGFVAVVFSLASLLNAGNAWLFFRQRPPLRWLAAALLGAAGLALVFHDEFKWAGGGWLGPACALVGTYVFSLGNMVGARVQRYGLGVFPANAYAMSYGALLLGALIVVRDLPVALPADAGYWGAMAFLVIIGSVLGFGSYLTLVRRIGAARAGYATVLFPVVALTASTWLEGYTWTLTAVVGTAMVILGNLIMFWPAVRRDVLRRRRTANTAAVEVEGRDAEAG